MRKAIPHRRTGDSHGAAPRRGRLLATFLLALLLALPAVHALAVPGTDTAAGQVHLRLARLTEFAARGVGVPARQLARGVPARANALVELRGPAATTEEELRRALDELRAMGSLANLDPHYAPALVAAGRAYLAASGRDPLSASIVNPEYLGLEGELKENVKGLRGLGKGAGRLSGRVRRLTRALLKTKRLAQRLERRELASGGGRAP